MPPLKHRCSGQNGKGGSNVRSSGLIGGTLGINYRRCALCASTCLFSSVIRGVDCRSSSDTGDDRVALLHFWPLVLVSASELYFQKMVTVKW